ncbi:MAG: hypothetical protein V1944_00760 [Candidatus Aenigmatarchaeota archaeon]
MKTCPKCGRAFLDDFFYCPSCGAKLNGAEEEDNKRETENQIDKKEYDF